MVVRASLHPADVERGVRVDAGVEREDHQRAEDDHHERAEVEQRLEREAGVQPHGVVVDDRAQAVAAVQHRQPEHRQVPDLPERVRPLAGDEREVDLVDALAEHQVHEQVPEHEHQEQQARAAHEQPAVQLEVAAAGGSATGGPRGRESGGGGHRGQPPNTLVRCRITNGTKRTTNTPTTPYVSWRWKRGPFSQKSTRTIRTPLRAWKRTAPTRPTSMRPTTGFL